MNEIELTKALVEIDSPSESEAAIGEFVATLLAQDFVVTKQQVGTRWNVFACKGNPRLLFTSHLDTVPGKLQITQTPTTLFGRGTCDAKASIAAMIVAAQEAARAGYVNFGLLFDVSEETDFSGIQQAVSLVKPAVVIVGEPTENEIVIGQKGLLGMKLICQGKAAHGATPEKGVSAITKLAQLIVKLEKMDFPSSELGKTTCNIGIIRGGSAINVVPETAEVLIEWRTTVSNEQVLQLIESAIKKAKSETVLGEDVMVEDVTKEILFSHDPLLSDASAFAQFDIPLQTVPYFTEAAFWRGANTIVYGPGDICYAHTDAEQVEKQEITKAKNTYKRFIEAFAKKNL